MQIEVSLTIVEPTYHLAEYLCMPPFARNAPFRPRHLDAKTPHYRHDIKVPKHSSSLAHSIHQQPLQTCWTYR